MYLMLAGISLWCIASAWTSAAVGDTNKLKGRWMVTVSDAPQGYQDYMVEIKENNKVYLLDVRGGEVDIKDKKLTEKDGKLTVELYVGESVTLTIWEENDTAKGTVDTPQGQLSCNFKKATTKTK